MDDGQYFYHPLENIEDVDVFYEAVEREHLMKGISSERPYTYWTIELYDQKNGFRGGGGLGILAADTRRVAEKMGIPFTLITPFYPSEVKQLVRDGKIIDEHVPVNYLDFINKIKANLDFILIPQSELISLSILIPASCITVSLINIPL